MSRTPVVVREAVNADLPALVTLWSQLRELTREGTARGRGKSSATLPCVEDRLAACIGGDGCRLIVAEYAGEVVGMALLSSSRIGQLLDATAVQVNHLVVADGHRRRGVGRALVGAAAAWAEETAAEEVVVSVYPTLREANRFYARLGFAPLVVRRVAPTAALRRRLAQIDRRPGTEGRIRRRVLSPRPTGLSLRARIAHVDDPASASLSDAG